jgi:hypothetical protein
MKNCLIYFNLIQIIREMFYFRPFPLIPFPLISDRAFLHLFAVFPQSTDFPHRERNLLQFHKVFDISFGIPLVLFVLNGERIVFQGGKRREGGKQS